MKFLAVFVLAMAANVHVEAVQPYVVPIYRVIMNSATSTTVTTTEATTTVTTTPTTTPTTTVSTEASTARASNLLATGGRARFLGSPKYLEGHTFEHVCSGTLVDDSSIITTVTCAELAQEGTSMPPYVGTASELTSTDVEGKVTYEVLKVVNHPNYNSVTNENNVAVLKLKTEVDYSLSTSVSHITWSLAVPAVATKCVASYWSATAGVTTAVQVNKDVVVTACATPMAGAICSNYPTPPTMCPSGANGGSLVCDSKLAGVFTARRNADCSAALWQYQELSKDAEWIWKSVSAAPILNVSFAAILALVTAMLKSL